MDRKNNTIKDFFESDTYKTWITNYHHDHQHPINRKIHEIGVPMVIFSIPIFLLGGRTLGATMFIGAWVAQIIGHGIEGKAPTFTKSPVAGFFSGAVYFTDKWLVKFGLKDESVIEQLGLDKNTEGNKVA